MPTIKFNRRAIEKLPAPDPSAKQRLFWDEDLKGFGVLVSGTTTAKTYVVQHRLPSGLNRRVTVAPVNAIDLDGARARARSLLDALWNGNDPKAARRSASAWTLKRALEDYLQANQQIAARTRTTYRRAIERYLNDWQELPLASITREMIEQRHRKIQSDVESKRPVNPAHWGGLAGASTANAAMRALRAIWNYTADKAPDLPQNPVRLRKQWYAEPRRERLVGADDLPRFYAATNGLENTTARDYILLLLFTGMRRDEAAALRWEEVDLGARLIRLPAKRTKAGRKLDLPMSSFVRDLLVARRALGNDGGWVFGANGRSGHIDDPRFALAQIAAESGIVISAHDLRRTFITIAESTDMSPLALKALVNHSLGQDVTSGYVQMTTERLREPAQRVCDRLMNMCRVETPQGEHVVRLESPESEHVVRI